MMNNFHPHFPVASATITNPDYWDCDCQENYIHHKSHRFCRHCGVWYNDAPQDHPDSLIIEVEKYLGNKKSAQTFPPDFPAGLSPDTIYNQ